MKRFILIGIVLFVTTAWATPPARWYHSEMVHNSVHDLAEAIGSLSERLTDSDSRDLRASVVALDAAVDHMHDELENDTEAPAATILAAFRLIPAPFERFQVATRHQQVTGADREAHLSKAIGVVQNYARLKFWMTPTP